MYGEAKSIILDFHFPYEDSVELAEYMYECEEANVSNDKYFNEVQLDRAVKSIKSRKSPVGNPGTEVLLEKF